MMENQRMEKYREKLKKRVAAVVLYNAAVLMCIALGLFHLAGGGNGGDFIVGFDLGLCVGVQLLGLYHLGRYKAALDNEEKLKKLYVAETDERNLFLKEKMGGLPVNIIVIALALGTIVAGFFSQTVFFSLMGACLFGALVKGGMKLYYRNKY